MHFDGADPHHIERLWHSVYGRGYTLRPDVSLVSVLSGLETACWDIVGKAVGKPVHALLGGRVHDRLRTYTYIYPGPGQDPSVYHDVDATVERALHYVDQGFTALKFDPAGPYSIYDGRQPSLAELARSEAFVKALRAAVGDRADLLFGTHGQFTPSGAIRMARRLESSDPLWFEEPCPPENVEAMATTIARQTTIPIATGERLVTKHEFARVLEAGAANILQMALGRVGGLLEAKKIASMAEAHYAQIAPHLYCGPIEGAANAQLAACTPNFLILESIERWENFHAEILVTPMTWEDGYVDRLRRARARRGARRGGRRGAPVHRHGRCTWTCTRDPCCRRERRDGRRRCAARGRGRLRLRRRRRGLRGLRARQPAERRRAPPRAAARGRRQRPGPLDARADRLRQGVLRPARELEVHVRPRARARRCEQLLAARPGARRLELDQRDGVGARGSRRLRRLGADRAGLVLGRRRADVPRHGALVGHAARGARRRRTDARDRSGRRGAPAVRRLVRCGRGDRPRAQPRLQRRRYRGRRAVPDLHAPEDGARRARRATCGPHADGPTS